MQEAEDSGILVLESPPEEKWKVHCVLAAGVCAISSAGAVMKSMARAAPVSRAGWRLQITSLVLLPGFLWQMQSTSEKVLRRWPECRNVHLLLGSGVALALHFAFWVYSIDHTSLPHSLLFVCTPPLMFAILSWLQGNQLSRGEVGGLTLGVLGTGIIALSSQLDGKIGTDSNIIGDCSAVLAAAAFVAYLSAGKQLREWMPLYLYAFPVTLVAATLLAVTGAILEGWDKSPSGLICGPIAWISGEFFLPNLYLGVGPGFVGHTGLNYVVKFLSPMVISLAISLEPVIGSLFGWLIGVSEPPGLWTCVGGAAVLASTIIVNSH